MMVNEIVSSYDAQNTAYGNGGGLDYGAVNQNGNVVQMVIGVFENEEEAQRALKALKTEGLADGDVSLAHDEESGMMSSSSDDGVGTGVLAGGAIGGIGGFLISAGMLALPGIGLLAASTPIMGAIGGAIAGGVAGGLIDWGISPSDSESYENHVTEGRPLIFVSAEANMVQQITDLLAEYGAREVKVHSLHQ
ncbi:MAG: hypothetical protein J6K70_04215 [Selenomonadales bacterium]|nr:hypothetical protein [Selenomonadales bacterium]